MGHHRPAERHQRAHALVSGAYDEATPRIVGEIHARIPGARWELFEWSSHMPHLEEPAHFRDVVASFLAEVG